MLVLKHQYIAFLRRKDKHMHLQTSCVLLGCLAYAPGVAWAGNSGSITSLGVLRGFSTSDATAVSADGSIVVGVCRAGPASEAFRWTAADGMQALPSLGDGAWASGVSADGSVVVGWSTTLRDETLAVRWGAGGVEPLATDPLSSVAFAVSGDGSTICGTHDFATLWTPHGESLLPTLGGNLADAVGISADGSVAVGSCRLNNASLIFHAVRWAGGAVDDLGTLGGANSFGYAVSADGSAVTGKSQLPSGAVRAFRWKEGAMQDLGTLGGSYSVGSGLSADGEVVVGWSEASTDETQHACFWTHASGMIDLNTYLPQIGVDLAGWSLLKEAHGVSADGTAIVGMGIFNGQERAFLVTIPTPGILGDLDLDGQVDADDLALILAAWGTNDPIADLNDDGTVNGADLGTLLASWSGPE
jgi:probable HAF family extracellular repeat protein